MVGWLWGMEICLSDAGACVMCFHWLLSVGSSYFRGLWVVVEWLWGMETCLAEDGACVMSVH